MYQRGVPIDTELHGLKKGVIYTLDKIELDDYMTAGYEVFLVEIDRGEWNGLKFGYAPERFKVLELPKILREIEAGGSPDPNAVEEPKKDKTKKPKVKKLEKAAKAITFHDVWLKAYRRALGEEGE